MRHQIKKRGSKPQKIRLLSVVLAFLMAMLATAQAAPVGYSQDHTSRNGLVRVRLASLGTLNSLTLTLKGAYTANNGQISFEQGAQLKIICNAESGQLSLSASGQDWSMGEYFTLNRADAGAYATISQAGGNPYPADFSIRSVKNGASYCLQPVAHIQVEDYLYGVLPYEMGNSAPLEALKAQAIAARTYTIRMMNDRSGNTYDVVDTSADQLYKGTASGNNQCKAAVDATKGMVLKFGSRYAETFYSSSNGGQTESAQNIWGGKGYDYLRVTDDPYDLASGSAKTKTATIYKDLNNGSNRQPLIKLLKEKAVACLKRNGYAATAANTQLIWLEKIQLHTPKYPAPSKLFTKADFTLSVETVAGGGSSSTTSVIVTTDIFGELEGLLGMSVQSSSNEIWTLSSNDTAYMLKAGRYGHGVGMSQYGAMEMARRGFGYADILGFYYPGCTNVKLNLSSSPMQEAGSEAAPETQTPDTTQPDATEEPQATLEPSAGIQQDFVGYATVQANGFLNLRQSPSLDAPILGIAIEGATVKVLSLEGSWAVVEYHDLQAYAMRKLLSDIYQMEPSDAAEDTGSSDTAPAPLPEQQPSAGANQAMVFCLNGFVNFREEPSLSSSVLMQLPHGAYLDVMEVNGEFTHVSYMGIQGYVMNSFLVKADAFGGQPQETVSQPTETVEPPQATETPEPKPSQQPAATDNAPSTPQPTPEISDSQYSTATVTTQRGSLNLREEPQDYAFVLIQIPQYAQVEAYSINNEWCRVRYGNLEGYAMSRFLTFAHTANTTPAPTPFVREPTHCVTLPDSSFGQATVVTEQGSLNLRMTPDGAVLITIPQGQKVNVYSVEGKWALVSYQSYSGYVMTAYLSMPGNIPFVSDDDIPAEDDAAEDRATAQQETPLPMESPTPTPVTQPSFGEQANHTLLPELPDGYIPLDHMVAIAGAGDAAFRSSPSLNDRALFIIPASQQFEALACSDEWCIGIWENTIGYVKLSEVALYASDTLQ